MRLLLALLTIRAFAQQPEQKPPDTPSPAEPKAESPAPSTEKWITGNIDFGYRWLTDVRGNFQEYRSVVNLGEGPKLFGVDLVVQDPKKRVFDRLDLRAYGWGGDPYNTAHLDARKQGVYELSADYRNIAYFNAVPSFANPQAPAGFDKRTFDIHRRIGSFSFDLFPGKRFIPYVAYERNSNYGNGIETWVQDANNEFAVPTVIRDTTNNFRGGLRVEFNRFHLTLEQGGTTYRGDDNAYWKGTNLGDRTTPVLGSISALYGLVQAYGIRGHGPYSRALLTASPTSWMNVYGQFLYSEPKSEAHFNELAFGSFASFTQVLLYSGQQTLGSGAAVQPHTSGNVGLELRPLPRLRILESVTIDRMHDTASPLVATLLLNAGNPTTSAPNYSQIINYTQQQTDVFYDLTGRLTLRGGYRLMRGDATVLAGQLSQTGSLVSGELRRDVALAGLNYRASQKFSVNLDYEGSSSDRIYFRTSLNEYHKARARARYQVNAGLTVQANFQVLNNQNPAPGLNYDFQSRDNAFSVFWTPAQGKRFTLMGEYDRSTLRSSIGYLDLPFFTPARSIYHDDGHSATSAIDVAIPGWAAAKLTAGGSLFVSSGSRASRYYQPLVRLSLPLPGRVYWNTEWRWFGFGEQFYLFEGFRTHIFVTGLRVTR